MYCNVAIFDDLRFKSYAAMAVCSDGPMIKEYDIQVQYFFDFLEKLQAREGDPIYSIARISLPFM